MNAEEIRIEKAAIRSEKIRLRTDPYLHKNAAMWLGSGWGLKQKSSPVPVPNLIFKLPTVVDRNQVRRLTITQRVRLARADAILKAKQKAEGIRVVTITEKLCSTCSTVKKAEEFNKSTKRKDGLQLRCKRCQAVANAESCKRRKLKEVKEMPLFEGTLKNLNALKSF
tara:strand:- start:73 stop:576 length:504 start_codon:yes stop_codon:yes gene_type:complete